MKINGLLIITAITLISNFYCKKNGFPGGKTSAIARAEASSTLESKEKQYSASNLFDNSIHSWCEGKKGSGIGETITIYLKGKHSIDEIYIKNGSGDPAYFKSKNRVREMEIAGENGGRDWIKLNDNPDVQSFKLNNEIEGMVITLRIKDIYKGENSDDTCLSELDFKPFEIKSKKPILEGRNFPVKVKIPGYTMTLLENGKLQGDGKGLAQCDLHFEKGSWKNRENGNVLFIYTIRRDKNCSDMRDGDRREKMIYDNYYEIEEIPDTMDAVARGRSL